MNIRAKLTFAFTAIVVFVGMAVAVGSYAISSRQLHDDVDSFLKRRGDEVASYLATPVFRGRGFDASSNPILQPDAITQVLNPSGTVALVVRGQPQIPSDQTDVLIAQDGDATERLRNVDIDGKPYRVLTVGLRNGGAVQIGRDLSVVQRELGHLRARLLIITLLGSVTAAVASLLIARRLSRPIQRLAGAAEHIAATQDLSTDLSTAIESEQRSDEVGRLAGSLNVMLRALATSRDQQKQLIRDASHELRTPLTSLRTNLEIIGRSGDAVPPEERERMMGDALAELDELTNLVTEMVELATDSRSDEPEQRVDLGEVVENVVDRFRRRTNRQISVFFDSPAVLMGRPMMLDRIVSNLVDNGIKFSPDGSPIDIRVAGGTVQVRDHGPGIAPEDLPRVWDRFYRADASRDHPGSGLGLAIVRQLAEAHRGTVHATNAADGGAIVGFTVPTS